MLSCQWAWHGTKWKVVLSTVCYILWWRHNAEVPERTIWMSDIFVACNWPYSLLCFFNCCAVRSLGFGHLSWRCLFFICEILEIDYVAFVSIKWIFAVIMYKKKKTFFGYRKRPYTYTVMCVVLWWMLWLCVEIHRVKWNGIIICIFIP